jgi:hypothetical protein
MLNLPKASAAIKEFLGATGPNINGFSKAAGNFMNISAKHCIVYPSSFWKPVEMGTSNFWKPVEMGTIVSFGNLLRWALVTFGNLLRWALVTFGNLLRWVLVTVLLETC